MATMRQTRANQHNAQQSTGPKTEEGKARSRANALKHGLSGAGVVLTEAQEQAVQERMESWRPKYSLADADEEWLYRQMIVATVQVDQCQAESSRQRIELATRAESCWEPDRALEVDNLGAHLAADPARVAGRLLRTVQGCRWLLDRWDVLGEALGEGPWSEEQESHAFDLLGMDPMLRIDGHRPWETLGKSTAEELVQSQIERLERLHEEALGPLDDLERESAAEGRVIGAAESLPQARALERLQRRESAAWRKFLWARGQLLNKTHRTVVAPPAAAPVPAPPPVPSPAPAPVPTPPEPRRTQCDTGSSLPVGSENRGKAMSMMELVDLVTVMGSAAQQIERGA